MTLITGFTCPPTIYFKFITKCDKCYYKVRQLFLLQSAMVCYYKVRPLFYYKVRQVLLQSATGITKCDNFITKCDRYYKVRRLLQSATAHDDTFKISDFPITCSRAVCHLGIIVIMYIWKSIYYQIYGIICPCFVRGLISLFRWLYQSVTKPFFAPISSITMAVFSLGQLTSWTFFLGVCLQTDIS